MKPLTPRPMPERYNGADLQAVFATGTLRYLEDRARPA